MTNCYSKGVSFSQQDQIVFFFSSNTILFNVSFITLDSCFKGSFLFFHFRNLFKFKWPFETYFLSNCCIFFFLQCCNISRMCQLVAFQHLLVNGISEMSFEKSETWSQTSLWLMKEVCCRFSTKSYLFTENSLSTAACPWDKVNTILKTVQHFPYLVFACIRSTKKESKQDIFWPKLKKASMCSFWAEETSWKYSLFAASARFDEIRFKLYNLSTSLSKESTNFCLSDTMLQGENEDSQRATWYLSHQCP